MALTGRELRPGESVHGLTILILIALYHATGMTQAGDGSAHGMRQPTMALTDLRHGSTLDSFEHGDQHGALRASRRSVST
jgi:hypothetical protein